MALDIETPINDAKLEFSLDLKRAASRLKTWKADAVKHVADLTKMKADMTTASKDSGDIAEVDKVIAGYNAIVKM